MEYSSIERLSDRRGLLSTGCLLGRFSQSPHGALYPYHPVTDIHIGGAQARNRQSICLNQVWVKEAIDLHHLERGLPEATFYVFIFNLFSYFTASKSIYSLFILHLEKPSSVGDTKGQSDGPATTKLTIFLRKKDLNT